MKELKDANKYNPKFGFTELLIDKNIDELEDYRGEIIKTEGGFTQEIKNEENDEANE